MSEEEDTQDNALVPFSEEAQELARTSAADHARSLASAALSAIPLAGGPLASLFNDYIPNQKEKRFQEFIEGVAAALDGLEDSLDEKCQQYILSDEYAYLFEKSLIGAVQSYQEDKVEAYRAILVNSLLPDAPDEDHKLYFVGLLDAFTPLHIRILRILRDPVVYDEETGKRVGEGGGISTSRLEIMRTLMPEYQEELLEGTWRDLSVRGMVSTDSLGGMITDKGILQMRNLLTPMAQQFISFVTVPE